MFLRFIALCSFSVLFALTMNAKPGTIKGQITDKETGEPLIGANVVIQDPFMGTVTDLNGEYILTGVEPGTYNIRFSYITYTAQLVEGVEVSDGGTTVLNIELAPESVGLKEIVVQATQVDNTEAALLAMRKRSLNVQDGISSEQISSIGSANAAESMKSVTGASVVDGKYVYVRGLGDRYSNSQLNGANIPSNDPYRNSFQLDLIPSNMIDNVIASKTFTPDQPGNFSGGNVNVTTKSFPDNYYLRVSTSLGYNNLGSMNDRFLTYQGGQTDWLGFDDGSRALPGIWQDESVQGQLTGNYTVSARKDDQLAMLADDATKSLNNTFMPSRMQSGLDHAIGVSTGNFTKFLGKQLGYNVGVSYKRGYDYYNDGLRSSYRVPNSGTLSLPIYGRFEDEKSEETVHTGMLGNVSMKLNSNNKVGVDVIYNHNSSKVGRLLFGQLLESSSADEFTESRSLEFKERGFFYGKLSGEHNFENANNLKIEWAGSFIDQRQDEPDLRYFANKVRYPNSDAPEYFLDPSEIAQPTHFFRELHDQQWEGKLDITIPITSAGGNKLKFGGLVSSKQRSFTENSIALYKNSGAGSRYSGNPDAYFAEDNLGLVDVQVVDLPAIKDTFYLLGVYGTDNTAPGQSYDGSFDVYSGYGMGTFQLIPRLKLVAGARLEYTDIKVSPSRADYWFIDGEEIYEATESGLDILPSVNLILALNEDMNLRAAYTHTLARPNMREKSPFLSFDFFGGGFFYVGNPDLKRTNIKNVDLRWELFPRPGELIAVSTFYKHFTNPIVRQFTPGASSPEVTWVNLESGQLGGIELELRKSLDFISPTLQNFSLNANFSYILSRLPLTNLEYETLKQTDPTASQYRPFQGQSPFLVNAMLSYESDSSDFRATLNYNVFGERLSEVGRIGLPDVYEQPMGILNLTVSKTFTESLTVSFSAQNILDAKIRKVHHFNDQDFVIDRNSIGRAFSLGVAWEFNRN